MIGQIRRNRLENIILLVPPDGFDLDLIQSLRDLSAQMIGSTDVRFDIVLIGSGTIPKELRDLSVRSGGVVLTISDVHEVGALAQRLRNEQASGAWVTIPRQGRIPFTKQQATKKTGRAQEPKKKPREVLNFGASKPEESASDHLAMIPKLINKGVEAVDSLFKVEQEFRTKHGVETGAAPALGRLADFRRDLNQIVALGKGTIDGKNRNKPLNNLKSVLGQPTVDQRAAEVAYAELINAVGRARRSLATARFAIRERQGLLAQVEPLSLAAQNPPQPAKERAQAPQEKTPDQPAGTDAQPAQGGNPGIPSQARPTITADEIKCTQTEIDDGLRTMSLVVRALEDEVLALLPYRPIFQRLDLDTQSQRVEAVEAELHRENGAQTPPKPQDEIVAETRYESVQFWAEEGAEFELIIGLSHIPDANELVAPQEVLNLTVSDRNGRSYPAQLDHFASTPTVRVYRLRPEVPEGGILLTANLDVNSTYVGYFEEDIVHYTFSNASTRPNVQLIETLRQEVLAPDDKQPAVYRGSVRFDESGGRATIETQVYGGAPIVYAKVVGIYERITPGPDELKEFPGIEFVDDGTRGDRVKNDGTYTVQIILDAKDRAGNGAEYRVVIGAISTDKSSIVPFELGLLGPTTTAGATTTASAPATNTPPTATAGSNAAKSEPKPGSALRFERATTIHFRVRPDGD